MKYNPPTGATDPDAPYVGKNPAIGQQGSKVPPPAIEHPQREIVAVIEAAGLTPDEEVLTQLRDAIQSLIASGGSPDISSARTVTSGPATSPPGSPGVNDEVLVADSPTGAFDGHARELARWNGTAWVFSGVRVGRIFRVNDTATYYKLASGGWAAHDFPATAHTHPQSDVTNLVSDLSAINAAIAGKVAKAGDTMTGRLNISVADANVLHLKNTQTDGSEYQFKIGGGGWENGKLHIVNYVASTEHYRVSIDTAGNVGVNTTSPAEKLHVVGKALATEGYKVNASGQPSMIKPGQGDGASATLCNLVIDSWWGIGFANTLPAAGVPVGENGAWIDVRNGDVGYRSALMPNGDVGTTGKVLTGGRPNTWKLPSEIWGRKIVAVGRATGASAAITFASAEPDTSYEVAGYGGWGGSGDNSGGTSTNLSLSSKSTGGCTVNLNDEGGGTPTGSVRMFYIIFRNA